jgi:hypothetical protein
MTGCRCCGGGGLTACGCSGIPTTLNFSWNGFTGGPYTGTMTWSSSIPTVSGHTPVPAAGAWWGTCATFVDPPGCNFGNPCSIRLVLFCDLGAGFWRYAQILYSTGGSTSPGAAPTPCVATVGSGSFAVPAVVTTTSYTCSPFNLVQNSLTVSE